jgi:hypothetical protein
VRIDAEKVSVQEVRLEQRREEVVGRADGVNVAGEMEVDLLHRSDLRASSAGASALDAEHRAERRLPHAEHRAHACLCEAVDERDRRRRLSLSGLRGRDRGHADELPVLHRGEAVEGLQLDLRLRPPVELDLVRVETEPGRDFGDRPEAGLVAELRHRFCLSGQDRLLSSA